MILAELAVYVCVRSRTLVYVALTEGRQNAAPHFTLAEKNVLRRSRLNYRKSEAKEAARAQFRGVWAAIATPFTPDGGLDEAGLRHNMRHFTDALGVAGIFCAGTMGEFWALTKEERKRVVEIVVEEARGKCMVIAHTGHHSPDETVDLTRHAQEVGADFAVVINPYYPVAGEQAIYEWFKAVVSKVEIGVWMFDTPFSGMSLSAPLTARIAEFENVCGIKVSRPLPHYAEVQRLCGDKIVLSHPSETEYLTLMRDHGMRVHMSSAAPFLMQTASSRLIHEYSELALAGRARAVVERAAHPDCLSQSMDRNDGAGRRAGAGAAVANHCRRAGEVARRSGGLWSAGAGVGGENSLKPRRTWSAPYTARHYR
jgi:4-hydroxy-tetrahydrodipicolinate synthase